MNLSDITIGADPELFIINENTRKVVSSIGIIPGTKGNPYVGDDMPEGFGLETDNILAEFNIPPVTTKEGFINNIEYMKEYIDKFVKRKNPELSILCAASQIVDEGELNSPEAKMFGCDPDYNVYSKLPNEKPNGASTRIRSCGFHLHIGYKNPNINTSLSLIKYLDLYLGVPSVLIDQDRDRRSLYGKAGCFRLCKYGCEYRTLSGALMDNTDNLEFVWNQLSKALTACANESPLCDSSLVEIAINNSDIKVANKIIKQYKIL